MCALHIQPIGSTSYSLTFITVLLRITLFLLLISSNITCSSLGAKRNLHPGSKIYTSSTFKHDDLVIGRTFSVTPQDFVKKRAFIHASHAEKKQDIEETKGGIDEDLYSRQMLVYGKTSQKALSLSHVVVIGGG